MARDKIGLLARFAFLIAIIVLCVFAASCAGRVTGEVFYDVNNNQLADANEKPAAFAKVLVTVDGEKKVEGYTLPDGSFSARFKPNGKKQKVCVSVDTKDAKRLEQLYAQSQKVPSGKKPGEAKSGNQEQPATEEKTPTAIAGKAKGATVEGKQETGTGDTEDNGTGTGGTSTEEGKKDEGTGGSGTGTEDGKKDDGTGGTGTKDDKKDDGTGDNQGEELNKTTVTDEGYCQVTQKNADFTIPVKVDMTAAIANLPTPMDKKCRVGKICEVNYAYPAGFGEELVCHVEPPALPSYLKYSSPPTPASSEAAGSAGAGAASSEVLIDTAELPAAKAETVNRGGGFQADISEVKKGTLYFTVDEEELGAEAQTAELKLRLKCGDNSYDLKPIRIICEPATAPDLEWSLNMLKEDKIVELTIKNVGDIPAKKIYSFIVVPPGAEVVDCDKRCQNHGNDVQCNFDSLAPGEDTGKIQVAFSVYDEYQILTFSAEVYVGDEYKKAERPTEATYTPDKVKEANDPDSQGEEGDPADEEGDEEPSSE
jgi:hypothetical protein